VCRAKCEVRRRRAAKKPLLEREVYRDHDHPAFLARVREALEAME
jgi:hypothetical protein